MKIEFNIPLTAQPLGVHYGLDKEQTYIVEDLQIGQSTSSVKIDGKSYNTINFRFFAFGREIDIFRSCLLNPYTTFRYGLHYKENEDGKEKKL